MWMQRNKTCKGQTSKYRQVTVLSAYLLLLLLVFLTTSCYSFRDIVVGKNEKQGLRVQEYYHHCCGFCGRRMTLDDFNGAITNIQLEYFSGNTFCSLHFCTKQVVHYKKNKVYFVEEYYAVYDSLLLLNYLGKDAFSDYYPIDNSTSSAAANFKPLCKTDSLLLFNMSGLLLEDSNSLNYIHAIKGFTFHKQYYISGMKKIKTYRINRKHSKFHY